MDGNKRRDKRVLLIIAAFLMMVITIIVMIRIMFGGEEQKEEVIEDVVGVVDSESTEQEVLFKNIELVRKYVSEQVIEHLLDDLRYVILNNYNGSEASRNESTFAEATNSIMAEFSVDELNKIYFPYTTNSFLLDLSTGDSYLVDIAFDGSNSWAFVVRNLAPSFEEPVQVFAYISRGGLTDDEYKDSVDLVVDWVTSLDYGEFEFSVTDV